MRERFYPSDLTDREWALIEPLLPPEHWDGRKKKHPRRDLVDAILYLDQTGRPRRYPPADFPSRQARWVVERTLGWLGLHRRLVRGYERDPATFEALIRWAAIDQVVGRLARGHRARRVARRPSDTSGDHHDHL